MNSEDADSPSVQEQSWLGANEVAFVEICVEAIFSHKHTFTHSKRTMREGDSSHLINRQICYQLPSNARLRLTSPSSPSTIPSTRAMDFRKTDQKHPTSDEPVPKERMPQTVFWWTVARKVGIMMAILWGSKFVGKIVKHRGFSFLTSSSYDPTTL